MDDFQVFVKPVGAVCNLDCQYCYYLEKQQLYTEKHGYRMPDDLLEKYIIQHISASSGPELFFSWHGGEPTLAGLQFFKRVVELQMKQKQVPENWTVINGLQTNGTLLSHEWCRFLKEEHFVVGISLDGPENIHSIFRFHKNRKACFDEVIRGYRLLQQYGIPCEILCVVSSANVGYPLEIYRYFKHLKVEFITFLPLVEKDPGKQISERTVNAKAFGEFLCAIFDEWKTSDIGVVKIQLFEEVLRSAFGLDHTLCIFKKTCGSVPVVEHNGDFYSCDHFVSEGDMLGNIRETSLKQLLESPQQKAFGQAKLTSLPNYCLKCVVREMCNGACPKDRFIETPAGEKGLNYLCEGYKLFFNHCKPFVEQVAKVWQADNGDIV